MPRLSRQEILALYRGILKNARHYPSSNREGILREAKALFHENKNLTDQARIAKELQQAQVGLDELLLYTPQQMESEAGDWSVTLRGSTLPDDLRAENLKN